MKVRIGDKIRILDMKGEPQYDGKTGTVTHIDAIGQIHGTWGGCALIPGVDEYEVIDYTGAKLTAATIGTYLFLYVLIDIISEIFGVMI